MREYLDKRFLERRDWNTPMLNPAYAQSRPLPKQAGVYTEYTRKGKVRRPQHMATPSGAGSDPSSGIALSTEKVLCPIEYIQDYGDIPTVTQQTSWIDIDNWIKDELPTALKRRQNELVQNAFVAGRMTPGVWSAVSTVETTAFDASAEATVTLYGISFTFTSAPKYYGGGKATIGDLENTDIMKWSDVRRIVSKLRMAGARPIKLGKHTGIVFCISSSQEMDLLSDDDNGKLTAVIASGMYKEAVDAMVENYCFYYAGAHFIVDDNPFTEDGTTESKRQNYGPIHCALAFGQEAFGYMPMAGVDGSKPTFTVKDITKTGYSHSIGYMLPWQVRIVNPDWCAVLKTAVTNDKPNNYDPANPKKQLEGFGV
jgi:hypothetical protein